MSDDLDSLMMTNVFKIDKENVLITEVIFYCFKNLMKILTGNLRIRKLQFEVSTEI